MKSRRFLVFALIAALITAVLPFPKQQAEAANKPSGWDFGLTKQCIRSPLPGQTNYYEDLSGCGSDTSKSYLIASQAEVDGGLWSGEGTGPASQMFAINQPRSPLTLDWDSIGNGRKSAKLTTNFDSNTAAVKAGVFTWFALLDHEHGHGGPIPRVDQLQTKVSVLYNPKMTAGASRAFVAWQGFYNGLPYQIELNFHITDNWGDNFPQYPEVVDMFNWPAGSQGKFLNLDARYLNIPGLQSQMTAQPGSPTTLTIEWNRIIPYLIDRGFLPPIPGNDYANTDSTASFVGTEVRTDAATNAGNVALTVSNLENSEIAAPVGAPTPIESNLFTPAGGTYTGPTRVTFNRSNPNSTIYYTIDGSTPNTASRVLRGSSLLINRSLTLSAIETYGKVGTSLSRAQFIIKRSDGGFTDGKVANATPDVTEEEVSNTTPAIPLIYAPSADEKLTVGQTKQIMWNSGKGIPASVKLELYQNDGCIPKTTTETCTTIAVQKALVADKVSNNGSYSWTIPNTIPNLLLNRPVVLVLTGSADGTYLGQSPQFTIAGTSTTPPTQTGVTITQTGTASTEVGKPFAIGFQASPDANYTWSVDGLMPSGLTLSEPPLPAATTNRACSPSDCPVYYKNTAIISGAAKAAGTYNLTVLAKNENGVTGKLPVTITVVKAATTTPNPTYGPGTNFKYRNNPTVYYLDSDGTKMAYPSLAFLRAWGVRASDIVIMPDDIQFPDSPNPMPLPNGTLLKADGDQTVYLLDGGKLRAFTSSRAFTDRGNQFDDVKAINPGDRARLQYDTGELIQ